MGIRPASLAGGCRPRLLPRCHWNPLRRLMTLAIETSCDDTSVAVLEKGTHEGAPVAKLHFHKKVTSNNLSFQGVHPLVSLISHQQNLATLVNEAVQHLPTEDADQKHIGSEEEHYNAEKVANVSQRRLPDVISVTRGPGMRSNLFTGLDVAKGLAVAWQKPLVGVHHMQAHALTPRLVSALQSKTSQPSLWQAGPASPTPTFPFLSILASGGHTMLLHSASLTSHTILGSTTDIAVGDCLDKIARVVLPTDMIQSAKTTMYGAMLEDFAFSTNIGTNMTSSETHIVVQKPSKSGMTGCTAQAYQSSFGHQYGHYEPPTNQEEAKRQSVTKWGWGFTQPFTKSKGGTKSRTMEMSFSGLLAATERVVRYQTDPATGKITQIERSADSISMEERRDMAREAMRSAFEQIASRVISGLQQLASKSESGPTVVMAGGVAANSYLRHILASTLCNRGYADAVLYFPPIEYCTDNAAMIGWAGIEMYEAGFTDSLSIRSIRKWPFDQLLSPPQEDN